jgi:hypothetical protein
MLEQELLLCQCSSPEHQIIFRYFEDESEKEIYMSIHLNSSKNIFERINKAIKYIFGYKCKYGHFDEFILRQEDTEKFEKIVTYLKK